MKVGIPRLPVELLDSHKFRSLECQACYIALLYVTVIVTSVALQAKNVHIPIYPFQQMFRFFQRY